MSADGIMVERWTNIKRRLKALREHQVLQHISKVEWQTLGLAALIYVGWFAATLWGSLLPSPLRALCGGWLIAWHASLQHEAIHGHPTPWRKLNTFIAAWPLSLWLPYRLYRDSHLTHHNASILTEPGQDPETHYRVVPHGLLKLLDYKLSVASSTLFGRLTIGPALMVSRALIAEPAAVIREPRRALTWLGHTALAAPLLLWILLVCHIGIGEYLLTFVYPGAAFTLLRSFAEHRADDTPERRVASVEQAPLLGLLFLHNNLHVLHHKEPALPWYRLPDVYRHRRSELLDANGGLVYSGYSDVLARFLLRPHDNVLHPGIKRQGGA